MNTKESNSWYIEYCNTPNGVYNRIFRKTEAGLIYITDGYTKNEPYSLQNDSLNTGE